MAPRLILAAVCAVPMLGCRSAESIVSGTVTVDDQPLSRGYITFYPVDDVKAVLGAEVVDGKYQIKNLPPGPRRAVIRDTPEVQLANTNGPTPTLKFIAPANPASQATEGNQKLVEIRAGTQTLNFVLKKKS